MAISLIQTAVILGLQAQGDFGPWTCYTQRKGGRRSIVLFAKIWLSDPTTISQVNHRNRVRRAMAAWRALPVDERQNWQLATRRLSLNLNGAALWMYWHMRRDRRKLETIERQSQLTLITGLH